MKHVTFNAPIIAILVSVMPLATLANEADSDTKAVSNASLSSSNPKSPATQNKPAYGDNPSLGRVLLYKTGQGLQNVGDAIQRSSENTSNAIKQRLNPDQNIQAATMATSSTTTNSTTSERSSTVETAPLPQNSVGTTIVQGRLSQSTTSSATTDEANKTSSNGSVKTYAIGSE